LNDDRLIWKQKKKSQPKGPSPTAEMMNAAATFYESGRFMDDDMLHNVTTNTNMTNNNNANNNHGGDIINDKSMMTQLNELSGNDEVCSLQLHTDNTG
jgi:hypothetical protein